MSALPAPEFRGTVTGGRWKFDNAPVLKRLLASLEGKRIVITLKQDRKRRSLKQQAWWWGVAIPEIAEYLGYDRHEHEALHYELVKLWGGTHTEEKAGIELPNKRSSELTTEEFSDLMEWVVRFASEKWNLYLLMPSDLHGPKDKKPLIRQPKAAPVAAGARS